MRAFAYALATAASIGLAIPAVQAAPVTKHPNVAADQVSAQTKDKKSTKKKSSTKKETTGRSTWGGG